MVRFDPRTYSNALLTERAQRTGSFTASCRTVDVRSCSRFGTRSRSVCPNNFTFVQEYIDIKATRKLRLALLRALSALLRDCTLTEVLLSSRAARAVLPSVTALLSTQTDVQKEDDAAQAAGKGKKGKKRARGYEGDEVFKTSRPMLCPTKVAGQVVLAALDGLSDHRPVLPFADSRFQPSISFSIAQLCPPRSNPSRPAC